MINIFVKTGTAAPEPAAPALTRTAETWELSLAQVRVEAGATSILSAKITDERGSASLCGIASPAYVPSSVLEIVEGLVMQGMPLVGLPTPTSSTGAATKAYVDSVISGFGISDIAIDADKNWNGKSVTNMKALTLTSAAHAALKIIYPSDNIIASSDAPHTFSGADWVVVKTATIAHDGTLRIQHTHCATGGGSEQPIDSRVSCDGEVRATYHSTRDQGAKTYVTDVIVRAGSVVAIEGRCYGGYISGVKYMGSAGVIPLGTVPLTITVTQD